MSPAGITVLMAVAFCAFAFLTWRKLQIVTGAAARGALGPPAARLRSVLVNGFLQRRMVSREWRPGLMHAVIFLGFMSLLLRKLHLIAIGYRETASFPDAFGGPFAAFKDAIELAVIVAVLYAFYRRFVSHPARLEKNREAMVVLSLILAIMVTDFAFDGFRFARLSAQVPAIAHERASHSSAARWPTRSRGCRRRRWRPATRCRTGSRWRWCSPSWCCCRRGSTSTSSRPCRRCTSAAAGRQTGCRRSTSTA